MVPQDRCVFSQNTFANYRFVMTASCLSESMYIDLIDDGFTISKGRVAIMTVVLDLIITWFAYLALTALRPF